MNRVATWWAVAFVMLARSTQISAAVPAADNTGPYNLRILEGGIGVDRPLPEDWPALSAGAPWSLHGWLRLARRDPASVVVAALGEPGRSRWRGLALQGGKLALVLNDQSPATGILQTDTPLEAQRWYAVAATYDGREGRLFVDGREVGSLRSDSVRVGPRIALAPPSPVTPAGPGPHFGGALAEFSWSPVAMTAASVAATLASKPDDPLIHFDAVGVGWPLQEKSWRGLQSPQDAWTLPTSRSLVGAPVVQPASAMPPLLRSAANRWLLQRWRLRAAPEVSASGEQLASAGYDESGWLAAIVPGTVLTTLIARGVYPDPAYGLNNLAIPEFLSRQDYWYRTEFPTPSRNTADHFLLTFKGINYGAEIWLNGARLGDMSGAFARGVFDVTGRLRNEGNVLAVRVVPPPHPGIPHEQSVLAGPGENGGAMALDGPTFIAAEGWDWIPGIRDRNTGIWQAVELAQTRALRMGDPHVVTHLPLPATDRAEISITVPVYNQTAAAIEARISARFDQVAIEKTVLLPPGVTEVRLEPREFAALKVLHPRLWWPNGYGEPNLYALHLEVGGGSVVSDSVDARFGVRELTYQLSLFDHEGRLRRVEVDPTLGSLAGQSLVDVRHEAIKRTPQGWAASLTAVGENSDAVRPSATESLTPYLTICVNGVPIAARGGSWGMDDLRKRVSRERLEPYFRLQRAAHLNIIRNWLGQNTEEVFYDLADENGLLVLNDFWISTQDFQLEPQDPQLFLANARDVITRYRNHPSIAVWFGRNEGVPPPLLNEGLDRLVAALDGTRYYTGSSNSINLQGSGPYSYQPVEKYFTELAQGFSVEVGSPSLSTLESLRASIPAGDLWPLGDTYAYHDWHFGGNGDVASFMSALDRQYGAARGIKDFERKAQMMNYVTYRGIFEGFQAHLWTRNSGRLLWMSHPSWPSNTWQLYSSDYDAGAAYYAVKKACEPVHAQLDLPDYRLLVTNITREPRPSLMLTTRVLSIDNHLLSERSDVVNVPPNAVAEVAPLDLKLHLESQGLVLVSLRLSGPGGELLSDNLYWQGLSDTSLQTLNRLTSQPVRLSARQERGPSGSRVTIEVRNAGHAAALGAKLTVLDGRGRRVLPAYYGDNYISLLPGETRRIEVHCPQPGATASRVAIRGWNIDPREIPIANR